MEAELGMLAIAGFEVVAVIGIGDRELASLLAAVCAQLRHDTVYDWITNALR